MVVLKHGVFPKNPIPKPPSSTPAIPLAGSSSSTQNRNSDVANATTGKIPESLEAFGFYATPTAGASATAMNRPGVAAALAVPMPFRGSVVAITLRGTANISAGNLTLRVRKNGSNLASNMVFAEIVWGSGAQAIARFSKGAFGFVRDDRLDLTFTTSSGYSPTTTVIEGIIWVTQDGSETI